MRERITIDISKIREQLDSLPEPSGFNKRQWTSEEDSILIDYWNIRKHSDIARLLGVSKDTALARYRELVK